MGSNTGGSIGSSAMPSSSSKPRLVGRVTQTSTSRFKGKTCMSFDLIYLVGNVDIQEGSVKYEAFGAESV